MISNSKFKLHPDNPTLNARETVGKFLKELTKLIVLASAISLGVHSGAGVRHRLLNLELLSDDGAIAIALRIPL
jgi:hypothetical protein